MRALLLLLALLPLLPSPGAAQLDPAPVRDRFVVTGFAGVRAPYTTGFFTVIAGDSTALFSATEERGGNPLLGLEAEVRLRGPVSLLLGGAFSEAGLSEYYTEREPGFADTVDFAIPHPGNTLFAKMAASVRFQSATRPGETRPRPATDLFAGPGIVRLMRVTHPAANFGFKGAFPVGVSGVEFVVGVEDFFVFWDRETIGREMVQIFPLNAEGTEFPGRVDLFYDTSNILLLRLGASLRF